MRQFVVVEHGGHQPLPGEGDRHARGVAGDPAPAPLLGDISGGAAAAGGIEDQVAGVGGHEEATLDDERICLNHVHQISFTQCVRPDTCHGCYGKVFLVVDKTGCIARNENSVGNNKSLKSVPIGSPVMVRPGKKRATIDK